MKELSQDDLKQVHGGASASSLKYLQLQSALNISNRAASSASNVQNAYSSLFGSVASNFR